MNKSELLAKAKPILFNTPMVQATLDGRKTKTRRIVKFKGTKNPLWTGYVKDGLYLYNGKNEVCNEKPRYRVGDILYVRETWYAENDLFSKQFPKYYYKADYSEADLDLKNYNTDEDGEIYSDFPACIKWRPSIHMPKEAARIFLRVTDVRVERLQECGKGWCIDIEKEGVTTPQNPILYINDDAFHNALREEFQKLWDSTIKKTDLYRYGWNANPFVWVIEFERLEIEK